MRIIKIWLSVVMAAGACYALPSQVNYQGRLMDTNGVPVNGSISVSVSIYTTDTGGVPVWDQDVGSVSVTNGLYSFEFGDEDMADVLTNANCWLELMVDSGILSPRQRLVSVPFAFSSQAAEVAQTALNAQTSQVAAVANSLEPSYATAVAVPTGTVLPFAGPSAPAGYLFCDGSNISRETYSNLFSVLGVVYGAGDGSTTFRIPDLRGRAVYGRDNMGGTAANRLTNNLVGSTLGASGGIETRTITTNQMPSHTHYVGVNQTGGSIGLTVTPTVYFGGQCTIVKTNEPSWHMESEAKGGSQALQMMPPCQVLNYIIKY